MAKTIEQILHYENLCGMIRNPVNTVPANVLPPAFMKRGKNISGQTGEYTKVAGNRKTAQLVQYGAPSKQLKLSGVSKIPVNLMHTFHHILHDPKVLVQLQQYDNPAIQSLGEQEVARQTDDFNAYFENLFLSSIYSALRLGAIYFDGEGNLLPSSSGAVVTIDYGIPSGNQNQLNVDGTGAVIAADWSTNTTDIVGQLIDLKAKAMKLTGYPVMHAFYGKNIYGYFAKNLSIQGILQSNPAMSSTFLGGSVPNICDIQWHPAVDAFFEDSTGTNQTWWGNDTVVFTPDPSPDWWEILNGSYPIPTNVGTIANDPRGVKPAEVFGRFSYAKQLEDPVTIKHNAGDTFLPVIKVPGAVFIADVTP